MKSVWLGFLSSLLARLRYVRKRPVRNDDLKRHDYRWSTQRMGVHFAERIRDKFRFRWIRKVL